MKLITKTLLFVLLSFSGISLLAQEFEWEKKPFLKMQDNEFNQKIYIHFDKAEYDAGDDIWFKAYIIDPYNVRPDNLETSLNVELIGTDGRILMAELLRVKNGYAFGHIKLGDSIPTGNYLFRAYTETMRKLGNDAYYIRDFYIENPVEQNYISRRQIRENRRFNLEIETLQRQYIFEYFFESGYAVSGFLSRLAFYARNGVGKGVPIIGNLYNQRGDLLQSFSSNINGRGIINFNPEENTNYLLNITFPDLSVQTFHLENLIQEGFVFRINSDNEHLFIIAGSRFKTEKPDHLRNLRITIHSRNKVYFYWNVEDIPENYSLKVPLVDLPMGISVISVFDTNGNILMERNFYNPKGNFLVPVIHFEPIDHDTRLLEIFNPLPGSDSLSFSLSIIEHDLETYTNKPGIYKDITLTSELALNRFESIETTIANPDEVDLLMLTGLPQWNTSAFGLPDKEINQGFNALNGLSINGIVLPVESSRDLGRKRFDVTLKLLDDNKVINTVTNEEGYFVIDGFERDGEFGARLAIQGIDGALPGMIELFPHRSEMVAYKINPNTGFRTEEKGAFWKRGNTPKARKTDRIIKLDDPIETGRLGSPDQVIHLKALDKNYRDVKDVLESSVPGVIVEGNTINIRGPSSLLLSNQPLLMLDDRVVNSAFFLGLSPIEISHIEVYKGASSSTFGFRGANGAILAYSRRYVNYEPHIFEYIFNGFYIPRAFKAQRSSENRTENSVRTLHWQPYIVFNEDDVFQLELPEPSEGGKMELTLNGLDDKGNFIEVHRVLNDN